MKVQNNERQFVEKTVFVWDGTSGHISLAEQWLKGIGGGNVIAVHAMPHESIYTYGSIAQESDESPYFERCLTKRFEKLTQRTQAMPENSKTQVVVWRSNKRNYSLC